MEKHPYVDVFWNIIAFKWIISINLTIFDEYHKKRRSIGVDCGRVPSNREILNAII